MMIFGTSLALSALSPLVRYGAVAALGALASGFVVDWYHDAKLQRVEAAHAAYKARVTEATLAAFVAAQKASDAVRNIADSVVVVYRDRITTLKQSESEALNAIAANPLPECRLSDGLRDQINAIRGRAASVVNDSYGTKNAVPPAVRSGREPRQPRA